MVKLNDDEAREMAGLLGLDARTIPGIAAELARRWDLRCVVVTLGAKGAFVHSPGEGNRYSPGYEVNVVDPLGAGDAFTAAFIHCLLHGDTLEHACEWGNRAGASVVAQKGATGPLSGRDLEGFGRTGHRRLYDESMKIYTIPLRKSDGMVWQ